VSLQVEALNEVLDSLDLDEDHGALIELAKGLAEALDHGGCGKCGSPSQNAALWREYRAVVESLMEVDSGSDDDTAAFLVTVQTPRGRTKVGDASDS
jgi:hypothetical protein